MPITLPRSLDSLASAPRHYGAGLWKRLNTEPIFIWAQAIAFKVLVTIVPLILIATGVFGLVLRQGDPFEAVATYLRTFLPPGQSEALVELLFNLQQASSTLTIIGGAALVVTVITLFSALRYVIHTAMGGGLDTYRPLLGGYAFDARMAVQVGLLFLLSFALTLSVNYLSTTGQELLASWGFDTDLLARGESFLLRTVSLLVPFLISVAMFTQLYYFIPLPHPPSKSALFGACFTALLFELAKNGFTLYATYSGQFERYASGDEAIGNVVGVLIAFVFWVYFSGLVLVIGAWMTRLHEKRHRPDRSRLRRVVRKILQRKRVEAAAAEPPAEPLPEAPPPVEAPLQTPAPNGRAEVGMPNGEGDGAPPVAPREEV